MDGQSFDPKFGTTVQEQKVVEPIKTRDQFVQGLIVNQPQTRPSNWFNVNNFVEEDETLAEQTGASEFAAGVIRTEYNPQLLKKLDQDTSGVDDKSVAPSYDPLQDNTWLYGTNLNVTRYDALRQMVGLKDGQSFTEYYNVNKFVPAGYELDAKLLLREEKIKSLENSMLNGKMGYDTFLYKAYGKDILKSQGHDFSSSLYWYTRRKNGQFDSVKNNLFYMDQILRSAESTYIREQWNRTSAGLTLNNIEGAIASEKPISSELMRDLFPQLFEALDGEVESDQQVLNLFMAGQIGPGMFQPYIDSDGDGKVDYYLHTNGRLYSAKEQSEAGNNDAKVIYGKDGQVQEIYLPGAWSWDRGVSESALTQFAKIFYGVPELVGYAVAGLADLGEGLFGQGFDFSQLGNFYTWSQQFQNSSGLLSNDFFVQDGSLIKNGDIDYANASRGIAEGIGMVAGMVTLAGVAGYLGKGAAAASNTLKGTKLSTDVAGNFGYKLSQIKGFLPKTTYAIGSMASRLSMIKNGAPILAPASSMWGQAAEATIYLAARDFLNTSAELAARQPLTNTSTEDIFARTLEMTAVNAAITFGFRSINDNGFTDRYAQLLRGRKISNQVLQKAVDTGLGRATAGYVSKFTKLSGIVNTLGDAVENWATMAMNIGVSMNEEDYEFGESLANIVAGSSAMINNPSAMAMQIFQGVQAYRGSIAPSTKTGLATRDIISSLQFTRGTLEGVESDFRLALVKATGQERAVLETYYNRWLDIRQNVYKFTVDKNGEIQIGARELDANGQPIKTKDADSSNIVALLWLQKTLVGKQLGGFQPNELSQNDLDVVSKNMKKTIEGYNIEKFVVKHQIILGAYNSYMDNRQKKYEGYLKDPKSIRDTLSKGYKIYRAVEERLGRERNETDYAGTNKLSAAARKQHFEALERIRSSNFQDAYLANDLALLESSEEYAGLVGENMNLLEIQTLGGRFVLNNLTEERLLEIAKIKDKDLESKNEKDKSFKSDKKGFLIRYILSNLSTKELKEQMLLVANQPETPGSGDLIIKVKGAGTPDEKKRLEIQKVLDVLVYWENKILATDKNYIPSIRKTTDGNYIIRNQLENESFGLNIIDYVGSFLRGVTALKMQRLAGQDLIGFKTQALSNLMDRFNNDKPGTFKENIDKKDPEAIKKVNEFLNLLVQSNVITLDEARLAYDAKFINDAEVKNENSVARFTTLFDKLGDLIIRRNDNDKDIPDAKFAQDLADFVTMMESSSPQLRQALFKATGLTEERYQQLRTGVSGGLADLKKTLGNLLGQRLLAKLQAGSPDGSIESLSNEDFLKLAIEFISDARLGRTAGVSEEQRKEYLSLVFSKLPATIVDVPNDSKFATLTEVEYNTLKELIPTFVEDISKLDRFLGNNAEDIQILLGSFKLNETERKNVIQAIKNLKVEIVTEIVTGERTRAAQIQSPKVVNEVLDTVSKKVLAPLKETLPNEKTYLLIKDKLKIVDNPTLRTQGIPFEISGDLDANGEFNSLRAYVLVEYNGVKIPFYFSSGAAGKDSVGVTSQRWYPITGISDDWINKGNFDELKGFYDSPVLRAISEWLSDTIGDPNPEIKKYVKAFVEKYPNRFGIDLGKKEREFFSEGFTPSKNPNNSAYDQKFVDENTKVLLDRAKKMDEGFNEAKGIKAPVAETAQPKTEQQVIADELKKKYFEEYVNEEFERRTINQGVNTNDFTFQQKVDWLLLNDDFLIRNSGSNLPLGLDTSDENSLINLATRYINNFINQSVETPSSGRVYVSLNSFIGPARRKLLKFIKNSSSSTDVPFATNYEQKQLANVLKSLGVDNGNANAFAQELINEYTALDKYYGENPNGYLDFDLTTTEGRIGLSEFLKAFGLNGNIEIYKNNLAEFGIYGYTPDDKGLLKGHRTFDLVTNEGFNFNDLLVMVKKKEKDYYDSQRKIFTGVKESYQNKANAFFRNVLFLNDDSEITDFSKVILSTLIAPGQTTLQDLVETIGQSFEAEKVKAGKAGGLSTAINQARRMLSVQNQRDNKLYAFKLLKSFVDYLVVYNKNENNYRKEVSLKVDSLDDIKAYEDTGVWDVSYVTKTEAGKTYYVLNLIIKDLNEEQYFGALINWIKKSKDNKVNFKYLVPNTARGELVSKVSSPTTAKGDVPEIMQSSGTGDTPFGVLRRVFGYNVDPLKVFEELYLFDLQAFDLTSKSFEELANINQGRKKNITIKELKEAYKDTRNPFIRMALNTLITGVELSKLYLNEVTTRNKDMRSETVQLLMHPKGRKILGKVLDDNPNLSIPELTIKINQELAQETILDLNGQRSNISSLEQYGIEAGNDFVSSASLSSFLPKNNLARDYKINDNEVEYLKSVFDNEFLASTDEVNAVYNPYSNIRNLIQYSNDTNQNPTQSQLTRQGGQVVKFDVDALFGMSEFELQELEFLIQSMKSNFRTPGFLIEKLGQIRSLRASKSRMTQTPTKLQSIGAPSNTSDRTILAKQEADGKFAGSDNVDNKFKTYGESFTQKINDSLGRQSRLRINNIINNPDLPKEQMWAKYLGSELSKLGETASIGQRQILDISKDDNLGRYAFSLSATAKAIYDLLVTKDSKFNGDKVVAKEKAFEIAKSMMVLTDGTDFVSMPTKFLFINRKTGEIVNKAQLVNGINDPKNLNDFYRALFSTLDNDPDILIIDLNKNMMTGAGSLSDERFGYYLVNEGNKRDFLDIAMNNIKDQATYINELKDSTDVQEVVLGVLSRTVTRKDYEQRFFDTFSVYLDNQDLPESWRKVITNLIGNVFDTIFHNDGTYTTKELYEARELGFEIIDDEKFDTLISNADRKISETITFFITQEALPETIKSLSDFIAGEVDAYFATEKYVIRREINQTISEAKETLNNNKTQLLREAKENRKQNKKLKDQTVAKANERIQNSINTIEKYQQEVIEIKKTLTEQRNILNENQKSFVELKDNSLNWWNKQGVWILDALEKYPELNEVKEIIKLIKTRKASLGNIFELDKKLGILVGKYKELKSEDPKNLRYREVYSTLVNFKEQFVFFQDEIVGRELLARQFKIKQELVKERNDLEKQRRELFDLKQKEKETKASVIKQKEEEVIIAEKKYKQSLKDGYGYLNQIKDLRNGFETLKVALQDQRSILGTRSSLIDKFIDGSTESNLFFSIIKVQAESFNDVSSGKTKDQFLLDTFDEIIVKQLLQKQDGASINFRLLKMFKNPDGSFYKNVLVNLLAKSKDESIQKTFLNLILEGEEVEDTKTNYMFDVEAFYSGEFTNPFSMSLLKLKKVSSELFADIQEKIKEGTYKEDWSAFKSSVLNNMVESKETIYIPAYAFNSDTRQYVLIKTATDIQKYYPEYYKKYYSGFAGSAEEFKGYYNFIQDNKFKDTLSEKEYVAFKSNYVGKILEKRGISQDTTRMIGFNNKKYDNIVLTKEQEGVSLISNQNLLNGSLDIYNDILRDVSSTSSGSRLSLDEQRKRYGIDLDSAHQSEDDLFFSLFVFLENGGKLIDSNKNQSQAIRFIEKVKAGLGIKGRLTKADLTRIENKVEEILTFANYNNDSLTKQDLDFVKSYQSLFEKSALDLSKFQKEIMENQTALFRNQEWGKNWKVLNDLKDDRPGLDELAKLASNEAFQNNTGLVFDFVIDLVYKQVFDNTTQPSSKISDRIQYVDPKSKLTVLDLVMKGLELYNRTNKTYGDGVSKEQVFLKTMKTEPLNLLKGIVTALKSLESFKDADIKVEKVESEYNTYKSSRIVKTPEFVDYLNNDIANDSRSSAQVSQETINLGRALLPLINNFADIEDTAVRNMLVQEMLTMLTYNIDDEKVKGRMFSFGKNKTLTNINRVALNNVLSGLAAENLSFKSMYLGAQGLSQRSNPLKVFVLENNKYVLKTERVSDNNYYMSESKFKQLFEIDQRVNIDVAIKTVRKIYGLTEAEDLFMSILRQPSDKPNTLHNYNLKVIADGQGIESSITVDALRSNHSGDTDGDKLFIFKPTVSQLQIANNITKYQRASLNLIGGVLSDIEFDGKTTKRFNAKENFELIKEFELANGILKSNVFNDYSKITALTTQTKQMDLYNSLRIQRRAELLSRGISEDNVEKILDYSWLQMHDVGNTMDIGKGLLFTTKNQKISNKDWGVFNENMLKLSSYIFKGKLSEIDSVTGLYDFVESKSITLRGKNSGFGKLFETIGVHITEASLDFIKENAAEVIRNLINRINKDTLLDRVFLDKAIDNETKRGTLSAKDYLVNTLTKLSNEEFLLRDDIATLIMSVVEGYDVFVKSSSDYNNTLFALSTDKNFAVKAQENIEVRAFEKKQLQAIKDLYFSLGIDLEKQLGNENLGMLENLHDLLKFAVNDRSMDNQVRFSNPNLSVATKLVLNEIANEKNRKRNVALYKNKLGPNDWNNYSGTKTIYVKEGFKGLPVNPDITYTLNSANNLLVLNMENVFFGKDDTAVINKLSEIDPNVTYVVPKGGLRINDNMFIEEGQKIVVVATSKTKPDFFDEVDSENKPFVVIGFVNNLNEPTMMSNYKINVPGASKQKSTLLPFDYKESSKGFRELTEREGVQFLSFASEDVIKKSNLLSESNYKFYDEKGNLVEKAEDAAYIIEEGNIALQENTTNWRSNSPSTRYLDEPTIINNIGNPEALIYFGRINETIRVSLNDKQEITLDINTQELKETKDYLKRIRLNEVQENNGLRLMHLMMAKVLIYNPALQINNEERAQIMERIVSHSDLNNVDGYKDVLSLYLKYYDTKEKKNNWKAYVNKNPYFVKLFSKELHEKIFPLTITKISGAERDSQLAATKQNPVEQAVANGFVTATGEMVTLKSDVKEYDNVKQVGENFYIDGYGYIGILDLINNILGVKKTNRKISKATVNSLAPFLGARRILGNTFTSTYLPILTTDAKRGNTTQSYSRSDSTKTGTGTSANKSELLLQSDLPGYLPVQEKQKARDMFANDIFTIDEDFLTRILNNISYDEKKKEYVFDKNFELNNSNEEKFIRKIFTDTFRPFKNEDDKRNQLGRNFDNFAVQFDLRKVVDEDGTIRISINRIQQSGKIGQLRETLSNVLGSASYFDAIESNKERLKGSVNKVKAILESNVSLDYSDIQNKSNNSRGFAIVFDKFITERNEFLKNKTEAQKAFLNAYRAEFDSPEIKDASQPDFFRRLFELENTYDAQPNRPQQSVQLGNNKKHTVYVDKNMNDVDVIKLDKLKLTSSGISEEDQRSFEVSQIVTLMKKEPQQLQGYFMSRINKIKDLAFRFGVEEEFNEYMYIKGNVYKLLLLQQELNKTQDSGKRISLENNIQSTLTRLGVTSVAELNNKAKNFESVYGDVALDVQRLTTDIYNAQNITTRNSNEPIQDIYWLILPTIKNGTNQSEFEFAKNLVLSPKERLLTDNGHSTYAGYNFFRSIETTVYNLSRHIAAENFSARATNKGVLTNLPVVNFVTKAIWSFVTSEEGRRAIDGIESKNFMYKQFESFQNTMRGVLKFANTDLENIFVEAKDWEKKNIVEVYLALKTNIDKYIANNNGMTLSEAQATMKREKPESLAYNKAQDMYNLHEFSGDILAKINEYMGGDTLSKYLFNELNSYAQSKGLSLADKYGRKFNRNVMDTKRLSEMSMEWVSDALSFNIKELGGYEKNMLTKALSGDIYFIDSKLQDHLDKYFFTVKVPSKFNKAIRKLQSVATALIMSNPFKVLDRVLKYSLTDLTMMSLANPGTMFKVNDARKDLSAFMQSKGAVVPERLQQYLNTQGIDLTKTNFEYTLNDFQDYEQKGSFFKKYFDTLGKPFEYQTQLVRYAYWLKTVEDLDKGKTNVYGSSYYKKDIVDKIADSFDAKGNKLNTANENKASYLMSQQLGAPGDFPLLAKDLNGIFMFTTFPLALVRWAKGEANSMATAVKNLFVEGEQKSALSWLFTQGGGVLGSALFVQAIIMLLANLYNVDDETEEEWSKQQALPDIFATLIQGAPVFDIYNTADPIKLLSELTYAPFVEAAEERKQDAIYGKPDDGNLTRGNGLAKWAFQNILGKVNPAFKDPIEVVLGISSLGDSVYLQDGPGYENFLRKMSAYIFGGSGSRALNRYIGQLDQSETINLNTVFNGLTKVISAELGNTKAYKSDVKNYYKVLNSLKTYSYLKTQSREFTGVNQSSFNEERYSSLKGKLRTLFNDKAEFSKVYELVIEHLEQGGSLQEVRSAINNVSITGQISRIKNLDDYLDTLDDKERFDLEKAIMYEEENFPWMNDFRESIRQNIESEYSGTSNFIPRYYQPYYKMYNDSRNVYYKPYYSKYLQNPFSAYRSAWFTVNQIPPKEKK
jgi:hypothetical protein